MTTGDTFDISIDPRTAGSALCVWLNGKVHKLHVLKTPEKASFEEKFFAQRAAFVEFLTKLKGIDNHIRRIGVEQFRGIHQKDFEFYDDGWQGKGLALKLKKNMMECAAIRGMLLSVATDFCDEVVHPNKQGISKMSTELLCRAWKIGKSNEHTRDAVQLGVCVGMDWGMR